MALRVYADVYCCGHFHKKLTSDRAIDVPDVRNNKMVKTIQNFVVTGSALDYEEGYAEQTGLQGRNLGFQTIKLRGTKGNKNINIVT